MVKFNGPQREEMYKRASKFLNSIGLMSSAPSRRQLLIDLSEEEYVSVARGMGYSEKYGREAYRAERNGRPMIAGDRIIDAYLRK